MTYLNHNKGTSDSKLKQEKNMIINFPLTLY